MSSRPQKFGRPTEGAISGSGEQNALSGHVQDMVCDERLRSQNLRLRLRHDPRSHFDFSRRLRRALQAAGLSVEKTG